MKEPTLGNPQNTIEVLQKYNFVFQKKFGQNFLIDTHVLDKIIAAAEITKDDPVWRCCFSQRIPLHAYGNDTGTLEEIFKLRWNLLIYFTWGKQLH